MASTPPIPAGWEIEGSGSSTPKSPPIPAGFVPTGEVVDGDTIRLDGGPNARLSGFDAWESDQLGYRPGRGPLNIGEQSTNALDGFVTPQTSVSGIGKQTFGRPVVTLDNGGNDPIVPMLWEGQGYAAPEYLSADPDRAASYMEAERLGRLNRQGGFGTNHIRPDAYRRPLTTRTAKLAAEEYLAFDDQLPDDAPKLKRLDAAQEKRIAAYVASQAGNPNFSLQQYRDWFRNELGVTDFEPVDDPKFIESVRKGEGFSPAIDYSNLDAQSMRELQELIALSGLRPEDAKGYRDLLASGDQAQVLEYARSKGMTLDPRDVSEYFDARAKGGNAPIPLPIIDPGDGRTGAAARGFGDPLGFLDEMGALPDTLGLTGYRENVWNSDRSFGDIYENNLRQNRAIIDNDETKHPYYRLAGQFLSGSVIPIGAGARTIGGFAKAGATEGAIYGFGSADGNLGDRLLNVPVNSALGAVGGATVGTAIKGIGDLSKRFSQFIKRPSGAPVDEVADARRVVAFEDALSREVAPDATEITQDQVARAFQAADEAAGAPVTSANDVPEIPPGFQMESGSPAPIGRTRDRLDIAPSPEAPSPIPARGSPVSSAYPGPAPGKAPSLDDVMPEIQEWAKAQGKGTMFHGSPRSGITEFDPYGRADYGLFGQGTYLTDNPQVAAGYTAKGLKAAGGGEGRTIYGVQPRVENPIDMDAPANVDAWRTAAADYTDEFTDGMSNADAFRLVEESIAQEGLPKWEGAEMMSDVIRRMGHDGVTHVGGGRFGRGEGPSHRVVIALDPEQTQITDSLSVADMLRPQMRDRNWIDVAQQPLPRSRADMAAEGMPTLASERIPDVIDVNAARTRPMGDGPSPDLMRAATARVEPADVLPRASDEVSADEAARLAEGPYQPVPAPRERDYLDARQFPSRANPDNTITRRGPLDLVSYARAQGGMIDEGGELTAAGISNAARKGEDFAGGENRLGRLVDNESGATIEDMAQRAWSEGYFPELDAPPTIQEFVAALDDTYRGVGRRFRPQDQGEILAYEGARDQRLAVERARQDGAPLVDDLGRPATLDDMVANTPPPVDPDEWSPATLAKVGNVRVDKLDTPQEISRALKVGHDITGGFASARRGVITQAETEALASDLGMTADQLLARRKGQALNAEEALAARRILAASGNELVNMARRIERAGDDPGSEMLASFRKALVRHTAIQEQVSGATAEAGRTLAQFRMTANSREIPGRVLEGLVNGGGGSQRLKEAAEAIIDLERDPANLNRFVEKAAKPRWKDKVVELWYNFLLSGPQTHAVNVLSNTMTSLAQIPEHGAAWGIGAARNAFNRRAADRVLLSEVGARATGLLQGTKEGLREFARAFRTGEPSDFVSKVESQSQKAISGIKGEVLRLPTRLLTAEDELFKAIARRQALAGLSVRQASREGLKGADAKARAAQLLANPSDGMLHEAMDYARYVTFQKPLGPVGSKISAVTNDMPILKAVLPFIRTPTNLVKFAVERSPAAPMLREWRKDFAAGGARRDLAIARATVGTGIAAVVAELAARGVITGSAPSDDNKRRLMLADGWQPYSLKIGDKYYSYRRLDPFAMTFGTAADIATLGEGMSEKSREEGVGLVVASIISNLTNKTWLSGMTDALEALRDPERYSGNFIERLAGSATVPTGVAQVARTIDPTMRETPDVASAIQSRVPGLTDELLPKRDIWGEPITQEDAPGPNIISPLWVSTGKNDPITREILRVGGTVSPPQKGDLTPEQYNELQAVRGSLAKRWLGDLFGSEGYQVLPTDDQVEEIRKTVSAATKAAKANVLAGEPLPPSKPTKRKRRPSVDAPAGIPDLPPGFELER